MSAVQASLFDAPASRGASRRTDPKSSWDAARSMTGPVLRDQQKLVLVGVRLNGGNATAYEVTLALARAAGPIQQSVASKRLGELVERGMVRLTGTTRPGISQRRQRVYEVTPAGRAYLAGRSTQ